MGTQHIFIAAFLVGLVYIAYRDWREFRIPDHATLPLAVLGLVWIASYRSDVWLHHIAAALVGGLAFWLIAWAYKRMRRREGLGLGDVKLVAVGGLWLGLTLPLGVALGTAFALSATLGLMGAGMRSGRDAIPLGFYLALGFASVVWFA